MPWEKKKGVVVSIIISILGFSFLVFIHELGHFIFARMTGMKVQKFSIGFGPALYQFGKDTVYQIALLPFGGFVQIKGLNPEPGQGPAEQTDTKAHTQERQIEDLMKEWEVGEVFSPVEDFDSALKSQQEKNTREEQNQQQELAETEEERLQREAEELEGSFISKPLWARFLVVSGGPLFNAIFTLLVFAFMFLGQSAFSIKDLRLSSLVISEVSGAAEKAGVKSGDVLVEIGGEPAKSFSQLRSLTIDSEGKPIKLVVARPPSEQVRLYQTTSLYDECMEAQKTETQKQQQAKEGTGSEVIKDPSPIATQEGKLSAMKQSYVHYVNPQCDQFKGISLYLGIAGTDWEKKTFEIIPENLNTEGKMPRYRIGVAPEWERFGGEGLTQSFALAWGEVSHLMQMMSRKIVRGVKGEEKVEVASVVKITAISADTVKMGKEWFLNFLAFLSLNLAFLNLLPFPALDGGRLIFLGIEAISRRPVPPKLEMVVHGIGIMLLLLLTLWVTTKDILSLL